MTDAPEAKTLRVARLPYLNVFPYFLDGGPETVQQDSPRRLGVDAAEGRIDAGPLSLVDTWRLEGEFEPVGNFGIAVRGPARSVMLYSRRPWEAMDGARVGVTDQSATSVKLLAVLLERRFGVSAALREGFAPDDDARLIIGDDAFFPPPGLEASYPMLFDLGREWYLWRERPFVFARWVVRRSAPAFLKDELKDKLEASLARFERNIDGTVWRAAAEYAIPAAKIRNYLTGFVYRLGADELKAVDIFRDMVTGIDKGCGC